MLLARIKALCKEKGISIKTLESALNFGNGTIGKWEDSAPSLERVILVADYFGVSLDYLSGRTETKETANKGGLPDDVAELITLMQSDPTIRAFVLQQISTYRAFLAPQPEATKGKK